MWWSLPCQRWRAPIGIHDFSHGCAAFGGLSRRARRQNYLRDWMRRGTDRIDWMCNGGCDAGCCRGGVLIFAVRWPFGGKKADKLGGRRKKMQRSSCGSMQVVMWQGCELSSGAVGACRSVQFEPEPTTARQLSLEPRPKTPVEASIEELVHKRERQDENLPNLTCCFWDCV